MKNTISAKEPRRGTKRAATAMLLLFALAFSAILSSCSAKSTDGSSQLYVSSGGAFPSVSNKSESYDADYSGSTGIYTKTELEENGSSATYDFGERKIVKTVSVYAETKEFDAAVADITAKTSEAGGYIESSDVSGASLQDGSRIVARSASFCIRIPADKLDSFTGSINSYINITDKKEDISDISDSYYDTEAHLSSLKTQEERLLSMLSGASDLEYMLKLEDKLSDVRYQIETLTAQMKRYDKQVELSTVTISLGEVVEYTVSVPTPKTFGERFTVAVTESAENFVEGFKDFVIWLIYALPALVVVAIVVLVIVFIIRGSVRRSRKKKAQPKASAATPANSAVKKEEAPAKPEDHTK